jgi:hypothetical protein
MSLIRLLAVGRTLKGIRDDSHRYRDVTGKRLLPKFGSSNAQAAGEPAVQIAATQTRSVLMAGRASTVREQAQKTAGQARASTERKPSSLAAFVYSQRDKWFFAKGRSATDAPSSRTPVKVGSTVMQGELSLDKVKVVRNDLSEADLEVVPALRPGPMGREETTWVTASKREMGLSVWSRATAKLMGALQI